MRSSLLLLAASVVSAATLPKTPAPLLPPSAFPKAHAIPSLEAAKAIKAAFDADPHHANNFNTPKVLNTTVVASNKVSIQAVSAQATCNRDDNIRIEWRDYSTSDRQAFIAAIRCLQNRPPSGLFSPAQNRYDDFVRLHQLNTPNIHGNAKFLIWHRYFVWTFESVLRAECGFNRAMPWWDETKDAGRFAQSPIFTSDYFGQVDNSGGCVPNGAFAGVPLTFGPGTSTNTPHCLSRFLDEGLTSNVNSNWVNHCINDYSNFADMASCSEGGPHAYGHNGVGSVMSDVSASVGDPVFFMHHLFIDRNYRIWQNLDSNRVLTLNGVDVHGNALTLDTTVFMNGMRPDVKIRDIINTLGGANIGGSTFCYRYSY